jgi:hypothetical protein
LSYFFILVAFVRNDRPNTILYNDFRR